ncbi:MAG: ATP-binding protein [Phycisphaerales bacterium]
MVPARLFTRADVGMSSEQPLNPIAAIPRTRRLAFRVMIVVLSVLAVLTGVSAWLLVNAIEERLGQAVARETLAAADRVALAVAEPLRAAHTITLSETVDQAFADAQLAFLVIESPHFEDLEVRSRSERWDEYTVHGAHDRGHSASDLNQPMPLGANDAPEALLCRVPVFADAGYGVALAPKLVGYVVVGVVDPVLRSAVQSMRAMAIGVVCATMLIAVPITAAMTRRLVRPIRRMARATAVLAAGGQPLPLAVNRKDEIGVLARSFDDMTRSLAHAQSELKAANAHLEEQVAHRTKELERVNDLLRREIDTKNEFLRTVSHDLNAPLRNIAGMTAMIQRRFGDELPEEVRVRLERISANVDMESSMLNDLLELSRLRTRPYKPERVDLHELTLTIIEALAEDMQDAGVQCCIKTQLPVAHIEPGLIRQVLLNLIDNAVKYMGDRPLRRVTISHEIDDGWLKLMVEDTGPGIPESEHEKIFRVFQRGAATGKNEKATGRGIGLTSVAMVAERWGGRIALTSEVGVGSVFAVLIPADRVDCAGQAPGATGGNNGRASCEAA